MFNVPNEQKAVKSSLTGAAAGRRLGVSDAGLLDKHRMSSRTDTD